MPSQMTLQLSVHDLLIWLLVGLIAGLLASRVMLGGGLGLIGDCIVGIVGAIVGWLLAAWLGISIVIAGHPTISKIIMAFVGALVLLLFLRLLGPRRYRRRQVV
jgi:uncharacterized membrane protein YeaQ/YmgE (transglycosylase-associated protein family)